MKNKVIKANKLALNFLISSFLCFLPVQYLSAAQLTAGQVIDEAEEKNDGDTQISDSQMILINAAGNERVRRMTIYRKDVGDGMRDKKAAYFFSYPEDIKDTSYLNFDWDHPDKDDDSWLFLPALKKVKRLASADKSDAFLGSDFTYTDVRTYKREYWDYTFIDENVILDGKPCWLIEGLPKKGIEQKTLKETGYYKANIWVQKDNFVIVKGTFFVDKGKKIKNYYGLDVEQIEGVWTVKTNKMETTKNGRVEHTTIIKLDNVRYNQSIDDSFFTPQRMTRGVAR